MTHAKTHSWLNQRQSGALLHLSSLPSRFGIGNMGRSAKSFVDFLSKSGFTYWQFCPIGPTGYGDSPYQSFSSFAGNPYFIDLEELVEKNWLTEEETIPLQNLPNDQVDYGALYACFWPIMENAFRRFEKSDLLKSEYEIFCCENDKWLSPYSTFMALKQKFEHQPWTTWPSKYRNSASLKETDLNSDDQYERRKHQFFQFIFYRQWIELKKYADSQSIQFIGDVPIYVALDSADCWQSPHLFAIDQEGQPTSVAGVPPDYFSETGQRWGNPLYDWKYMENENYDWWITRLSMSFTMYDVVRLDHFRGFDSYWEIPATAKDATKGQWQQGPGIKFFQTIHNKLHSARLIAEDLGYINKEVYDLRKGASLPGMKIMQFGFGHDDNNVNLPHFFERDHIAYTGTHDNDTLIGWYESLDPKRKQLIQEYYNTAPADVASSIIRAVFSSVANLCVVQVQDILGLDSAARMNIPGTAKDNWKWRLNHEQLTQLHQNHSTTYSELNKRFNRIGSNVQRDYSTPPQSLNTKQSSAEHLKTFEDQTCPEPI